MVISQITQSKGTIDMNYNYKTMTNEIHKVEPCYGTAYIRHINGLYLAMNNDGICFSKERFLWRIEAWQDDRFYIRDISGHDQLEYYGGRVSKALDSGYTEQHWYIYRSQNGFVLFEHADSNHLFLSCSEENAPIMREGYYDESCCFTFEEECLSAGYPYLEFGSKTRKIILRVEPTILYYANKEWLEDFLCELERTYYSLSRLTGFYPYPQIEIRAYTNCNTWGYVFTGKPVVHINNTCMEEDIIRMRKYKNRGLSFGTLHEISHLFDKESWVFDCEALANIKLGYVLHELDFNTSLAPGAEYAELNKNSYANELYAEHGRLDNVKGLFCSALAAKLVEIASVIGWEAFIQTFRSFPELYGETRLKKLEVFLSLLGKHSGRDVRGMFTDAEWQTVEKNLL